MSELERITRLSKERTQEGRSNPSRRKDDKYVIDLIYLLEQSTMIIGRLSKGKSAAGDDVLTVKGLQDIMAAIDDPNLRKFFTDKISEGLGIGPSPEPLLIKDG